MDVGPEAVTLVGAPQREGCMDWAETGELAVGLGDTVHILVPNRAHNTSGIRWKTERAWHEVQFSIDGLVRSLADRAERVVPTRLSDATWISKNDILALAWSPSRLRGGRCALAVLTTSGYVGIYESLLDPSRASNWRCSVRVHEIAAGMRLDSDPYFMVSKRIKVKSMSWRVSETHNDQETGLYLAFNTQEGEGRGHPPDHVEIFSRDSNESAYKGCFAKVAQTSCLPSDLSALQFLPHDQIWTGWVQDTSKKLPSPLYSGILGAVAEAEEDAELKNRYLNEDIRLWAKASRDGYHAYCVTAFMTNAPHYRIATNHFTYIAFTADTPLERACRGGSSTDRRRLLPWEYDFASANPAIGTGMRLLIDRFLHRVNLDPPVAKAGLNCQFVMASIISGAICALDHDFVGSQIGPGEYFKHTVDSLNWYLPDFLLSAEGSQEVLQEWSTGSTPAPQPGSPEMEFIKDNLLSDVNNYILIRSTHEGGPNMTKYLERCPIADCGQVVYWNTLQEALCAEGHPLERCQSTFLVVTNPFYQKHCEMCSSTFIDEQRLQPYYEDAEKIGMCSSEQLNQLNLENDEVAKRLSGDTKCPCCGGKFVRQWTGELIDDEVPTWI